MLGQAVAELEGAEAGVATASGMAALHVAILALAPRPVTILATRELYGGTLALIRQDLEPAGYEANFIDMTDLEMVRRSIDGPGLGLVRTIPNPLCSLPDIAVIPTVPRHPRIP